MYWLFSCAPADIVFGFGFCLLFTACDCITGSPAKRTLRQVRTQISGLECLSNESVTTPLCFRICGRQIFNGIEFVTQMRTFWQRMSLVLSFKYLKEFHVKKSG